MEAFLLAGPALRKTWTVSFPGLFLIHILIHRLWLVIRI
jgi:hypothetical protein